MIKIKFRQVYVGFIALAMFVHAIWGLVLFFQYLRWVGSSATGERQHEPIRTACIPVTELAASIKKHIPQTTANAPLLYVTASTPDKHWTYFQLGYALYPHPVWWIAPTRRASASDWWISCPLTWQALSELAAEKGARYLLLDGPGVPEGLADVYRIDLGPTCSLLVLP